MTATQVQPVSFGLVTPDYERQVRARLFVTANDRTGLFHAITMGARIWTYATCEGVPQLKSVTDQPDVLNIFRWGDLEERLKMAREYGQHSLPIDVNPLLSLRVALIGHYLERDASDSPVIPVYFNEGDIQRLLGQPPLNHVKIGFGIPIKRGSPRRPVLYDTSHPQFSIEEVVGSGDPLIGSAILRCYKIAPQESTALSQG